MEIKIKPLHGDPTVRCSIHLDGRLTFSIDAMNELGLEYDQSISIGFNTDDRNDKTLYMCIYSKDMKDAFHMKSSGLYLYLNTKTLFTRLGYDFKNKIITFDIINAGNIADGKLFRLERWEKLRKIR